jgi:hypothetical protein
MIDRGPACSWPKQAYAAYERRRRTTTTTTRRRVMPKDEEGFEELGPDPQSLQQHECARNVR